MARHQVPDQRSAVYGRVGGMPVETRAESDYIKCLYGLEKEMVKIAEGFTDADLYAILVDEGIPEGTRGRKARDLVRRINYLKGEVLPARRGKILAHCIEIGYTCLSESTGRYPKEMPIQAKTKKGRVR